jgi:hypothetical protein
VANGAERIKGTQPLILESGQDKGVRPL